MEKNKWKSLEYSFKIRNLSFKFPESELSGSIEWEYIENLFLSLHKEHLYWVFRGMPNKDFLLQTSLERKEIKRSFREILYKQIVEKYINRVRSFEHLDYIPDPDEYLEIQSMMQHFGCASNLMDWTYSPYIAAYFATEDALETKKTDGVIYALNILHLDKILEHFLRDKEVINDNQAFNSFNQKDIFKKIFTTNYSHKEGFILPVEPRKSNKRLDIQQGLFTYNGNIRYSFEQNFVMMIDYAKRKKLLEPDDYKMLIKKIHIGKNKKKEIQEKLLMMNISAKTLFPGLGGFSKSHIQIMLQKQNVVDRLMKRSLGQKLER